METNCQIYYENDWLRETLSSIGYCLLDNGDSWRTSAVYRQGGNINSVIVYKQTGVWKDYAEGEEFLPFSVLVERTVGKEECDRIIGSKVYSSVEQLPQDSGLLKMEKIYPEASLKRLLPHYDFYIKRGISAELLKKTNCGYAAGYEMYQRLVFPIYNDNGKIHGFSGRYVFWKEGETKPKWKKVGESKNWAYPIYCPKIPECQASILETKTVYLVESIGDALSMMQVGIFNVLVIFGTALKQKVTTELIRLGVEKIVLCTNRDEAGDGQLGAAKAVLLLSGHFNFGCLSILLPIRNDINKMLVYQDDIVSWSKQEGIRGEKLVEFCKSLQDKLPVKYKKILNKLNE